MKSIHERMKENYENRYRFYLPRRIPVIIRLDGRAFHTLTKGAEKPYDFDFIESMQHTAEVLMHDVQGCKCAYVQSDEISLLLTDYKNPQTQAWFDYNLSKIISVSASIASTAFTTHHGKTGLFDSRAFSVPREEVNNYFISRQLDWIRNSKQMLSQSLFSPKELHGKSCERLVEMCREAGLDWNNLAPPLKYGTVYTAPDERQYVDFMEDKKFIKVLLDNEI